jgi:hypothetical protein
MARHIGQGGRGRTRRLPMRPLRPAAATLVVATCLWLGWGSVAFAAAQAPHRWSAGQQLSDTAVYLGATPPTSSITGTVVDASTQSPITGACVTVTSTKTSFSGFKAITSTTGGGDFSFSLPPGTYNLYVTSCGSDDYVSAVYDSSSPTHTSLFDPFQVPTDVITVAAGGTTRDLGTIELEPGAASLSGVVENTSGDPVTGVCVNAAPPASLPAANFVGDSAGGPVGFTGADGSYTANGLPPGNVIVNFTAGKCGLRGYFDGWYDSANPPTDNVGLNAPSFFPVTQVPLTAGQTTDIGVTQLYPIEPPTAAVSSPASGHLYALGESVGTQFSCTEAPGGPGLTSCVDSNGAPASYGSSPTSNLATGPSMVGAGQLTTSTPGSFTYRATATSFSGLSASTTIEYVVVGARQCKNGGWQAYGVFKSQGDCVSYVATKGKDPSG